MLVRGVSVDGQTRCAHYHSDRDVIAIRFKCCDRWYACIHCHEATAGHTPEVWRSAERNVAAVLCGKCRNTLTIAEYLACNNQCPRCSAAFNPGCAKHYAFYFEI